VGAGVPPVLELDVLIRMLSGAGLR